MWRGKTVVCIGGGPSLTQAQVDHCKGRARVIAINDAYRLAPWADLLYFCDCRWWGDYGHGAKLKDWPGLIVRLQGGKHDFGDPRIKVMRNLNQHKGLAAERDGLHTGQNSGYQAINLAVHLGAKKIVLLGYDMQASGAKTHWFGEHPIPTGRDVFDGMLPHFDSLVQPLAKLGIEVVNCTPGSRLKCFPAKPLDEVFPRAEVAA